MAGITHKFVSQIADVTGTGVVKPSDWNDEHEAPLGAEMGKVKLTAEGGIAIALTNKTGAASVKGSLVSASTAVDNAFILQANEYDTIGVVYDAGVADAGECWVVVSGRAQVLMKDAAAATRGYIVIAADTDGRAITIEVPTGTPTANDHWKECGHCIESKTAGTNVLAYAMLHFN